MAYKLNADGSERRASFLNFKTTIMENQHQILYDAVKPLMEYLQKYHDPHTIVIVDINNAEVLSGELVINKEIDTFLK